MSACEADRLARAALARLAEPGDRWLGAEVRGQGAEAVLRTIREGGPGAAWLAGCRARLPVDPVRDFEALEHLGARFVCPGDLEWPSQLDDLGDRRPLGLWVRGAANLRFAALTSIAIVGSRMSTGYGNHVATDMSGGLAERHWTVVSGAAYGVDAAVHRGALAVGGLTVAVLACGVDVSYPAAHAALLSRIADEGLLVSELPPRSRPTRPRFIERNRVIAALTRGTVVVEAALRSGALSTAAQAGSLCRHVMGVPGPVTSPVSAGVHILLRDRGGVLVTDADEVAEQVGLIGDDLAPSRRGPTSPRDDLDPMAVRVLEAIPSRAGASVLAIARAAGVPADTVLRYLGVLAAEGWVKAGGEGWLLRKKGEPVLDLTPSGDQR
ncbi:MAG: DNA-processing protein DprA [Streptomycetales bacterium]